MGYKSRGNWLIFKDPEAFDRIFGKKEECKHEVTPNIYPPICSICNEWIKDESELSQTDQGSVSLSGTINEGTK